METVTISNFTPEHVLTKLAAAVLTRNETEIKQQAAALLDDWFITQVRPHATYPADSPYDLDEVTSIIKEMLQVCEYLNAEASVQLDVPLSGLVAYDTLRGYKADLLVALRGIYTTMQNDVARKFASTLEVSGFTPEEAAEFISSDGWQDMLAAHGLTKDDILRYLP